MIKEVTARAMFVAINVYRAPVISSSFSDLAERAARQDMYGLEA
jgi:hypothetical protein